MTASPGREVDRNLLRRGALGSAQARADPDDAGGKDLGDLIEALGWGHEVGVKRVGHVMPSADALTSAHTGPSPETSGSER